MSLDPRMKSVLTELQCVVALIEGGMISDVAYVAIPNEGEAMQGLAIAPRKPGVLVDGLHEVAAWAGNTEKNAAIEKARADLSEQQAG